ncbi:helix-turn-helix transcriptional regulator, partial [Inquilinus limosus]|uniref:helix-turn-helix transcriptional regulator n=1 Tax=Inquilinus limosus TaxID=171674 RepID=UPI003D2ECBFF
PLLLTVIPVPRSRAYAGVAAGAAIFITDPDAAAPLAPALLRQMFGLTAAEAALAVEIGRGEGLEAAAERLSIARTTARTHLARIFDKTGTGRQAELVRLLLHYGGPLPPPD